MANTIDLETRIKILESALDQCAKWFSDYGDGHAAKGDMEKAKRNYGRALVANATLNNIVLTTQDAERIVQGRISEELQELSARPLEANTKPNEVPDKCHTDTRK